MFLADIDKIVKNWSIKTGTCKDSNKTNEKITHPIDADLRFQKCNSRLLGCCISIASGIMDALGAGTLDDYIELTKEED